MAVLLLAEVNGGELSLDQTGKAVTAAKALGDVTVLCASSGCGGSAKRYTILFSKSLLKFLNNCAFRAVKGA